MNRPTVAIRRRAVVARLKRALLDRGQHLYTHRTGNETQLFLIDTEQQRLVAGDIDLEVLARKVGALRAWEYLEY